MDAKEIGLAAKDVVAGIAAAAVGTTGGAPAAQGVMTASSGIDRLVDKLAPTKQKTRAENFDRADYRTKPQPPVQPSGGTEVKPAQTEPQPPALGDAQQAMSYLTALGWSPEKVQQMLAGPEKSSAAAIVGAEVRGTRIAQVDGTVMPANAGRAIPKTDGQRVPEVSRARVPEAETT